MASNIINKIKFTPVDIKSRKDIDFRSGDTVKVTYKIAEQKAPTKKGEKPTLKYRSQSFEGIVLARKHGTEAGATFTVRKVASGVGVERIFPLYSPIVEKIEVTKKSTKARRSKLYYIRDKAIKDVRKKLRSVVNRVSKNEVVQESDFEENLETQEEELKNEE